MTELRHFAVAIPLSGAILRACVHYQHILQQQFGVQAIALRSPFPHITLCAGEIAATQQHVIAHFNRQCTQLPRTLLSNNGIGVLALSTPLIYLRWWMNDVLAEYLHSAVGLFGDLNAEVEPHYTPPHWIAKSTLAYLDTDYLQLPQLLLLAREKIPDASMQVEQLALFGYTQQREECLTQVELT